MLAELGYLSLLLATGLALLQGLLPWLGLRLASRPLLGCAAPLALLVAFLLLAALLLLASCFGLDDFTLVYVAQHANSALPLGFKLAAVWGGHEGSMLFFVFALGLWGALVALCSRRVDPLIRTRVLAIMGLIVGLFGLYTLIFSSPFDRQFPGPLEGRDLNPMLQDIGLIIHPPLLYLGYVGFAVNFAFAMAALHSGRLDGAVAHWSRPWALGSWVFLTAGIVLGSWWAYYELGWGGWWFWDPVENASLLPWLLGTALLHALVVCEKRGAYGHAVLLLSIFTFSLSLLGTFVVRSGVLTSVHAFAVDPSRGLTLLLLLGLLLTCALTLFALRADIRAPLCPLWLAVKRGAARRRHPAALRGLRQRAARHLLPHGVPVAPSGFTLGGRPLFQYHLRAAGPLPDGADDPAAAPALAASGRPAPHQGAAPMPVRPAGGAPC